VKKTTTEINVSLPTEIYNHIESVRGDVPRSKFVVRLLEKALGKVADEPRRKNK